MNLKDVITTTGLSRSTIYKKMDEGRFPKSLKLSETCVRWKDNEIAEWIDSLPRVQ
jgi:prophage regulatory protein